MMNLKPEHRFLNSIAFSPDSKTIFVAQSERDAVGYDVESGNFVAKADESATRWRAVSPDGKLVAIADYDGEKREGWVVLRDAATGKEIRRSSSGSLMIRNGRWSRDGSGLVGATAYRACVWDVKTGRLFAPTVPGHDGPVTSLTFHSDGRLITASDDGTVRAWHPATGKELGRLLPRATQYWKFAVSPDGSLLAGTTTLPNEVRVWDSKTGAEVYKLLWSISQLGGIYHVRFTADDQSLMTYGSDYHVRAWDLATGKLKIERKINPNATLGHEEDDDEVNGRPSYFNGRTVDIGADGDTLSLGILKDVTIYSVQTGKERFKIEADEQYMMNVVLSPDCKRMVTTGQGPARPNPAVVGMAAPPQDYHASVWDLTQAKRLSRFRVSGLNYYLAPAFSPDGRLVVTGSENDLRFWDAATGKAVGQIPLPRRPTYLAFNQDGKRLAVAFSDPTVLVYDVAAAMKAPPKE
jgi:WD40 repeat protein